MHTLILFDIDGTLVWGGPAKDAFHAAMLEVFGTAGSIESHDFSGKTDPQIARELLTGAGFTRDRIDEGLGSLWDRYLSGLRDGLVDRPMHTLPGVVELLDALDRIPEAALGLVTGNIAAGARLKLGSVDLHERFRVGGFGSDDEVRNHLPGIAIERARATWRVDFDPDRVVVVGDTPLDVECGKVEGTRTVAVATGRWAFDDLARAGADHTLHDLSDTERVLEVVLG